jgi:hypothetical protein
MKKEINKNEILFDDVPVLGTHSKRFMGQLLEIDYPIWKWVIRISSIITPILVVVSIAL